MPSPEDIAAAIADRLQALPKAEGRRLVAVAGPPASGKSTVAKHLQSELNRRGVATGLVAMDGFHLDNPILDARGLRARKGAPETFDLGGFAAFLQRLRNGGEVIAPTFDRTRDVSVGSSSIVSADAEWVVVEGNYLLLDEPGWRDLNRFWDFSVSIQPSMAVLEERLIQRWLDHGFDETGARRKTETNDLPNARRVIENSLQADNVPQV